MPSELRIWKKNIRFKSVHIFLSWKRLIRMTATRTSYLITCQPHLVNLRRRTVKNPPLPPPLPPPISLQTQTLATDQRIPMKEAGRGPVTSWDTSTATGRISGTTMSIQDPTSMPLIPMNRALARRKKGRGNLATGVPGQRSMAPTGWDVPEKAGNQRVTSRVMRVTNQAREVGRMVGLDITQAIVIIMITMTTTILAIRTTTTTTAARPTTDTTIALLPMITSGTSIIVCLRKRAIALGRSHGIITTGIQGHPTKMIHVNATCKWSRLASRCVIWLHLGCF